MIGINLLDSAHLRIHSHSYLRATSHKLQKELDDIIKDIEVELEPVESRPIMMKLKEFVAKLKPLPESKD